MSVFNQDFISIDKLHGGANAILYLPLSNSFRYKFLCFKYKCLYETMIRALCCLFHSCTCKTFHVLNLCMLVCMYEFCRLFIFVHVI